MEKRELLYEGKAKKVYATQDPELLIVSYKDDATAFDGTKKGTIRGKGAVNNRMSNFLMGKLSEAGIPTHFVQELNDRETVVKKVEIVPLEVIVRNASAGHFSSRYGVEEGILFDEPVLGLDANHRELFYHLLLRDYEERQRTIILATHLIEEVANIIEEVVLIDKGRLLLQESVETLLDRGYCVSGSEYAVRDFCADKHVIGYDELGALRLAYILGALRLAYILGAREDLPKGSPLQISHMNLQKLFVKLTEKGGN